MQRTLTLSILLMGLLAVSLTTGCGGGLSSITGPSSVTLQEMAAAE